MKKVRTRGQTPKARRINFSSVSNRNLLQPDHSPAAAAPGTDIVNEPDGVVLFWLLHQNAAKIGLKDIINGCK